jgi:hypothetical protein
MPLAIERTEQWSERSYLIMPTRPTAAKDAVRHEA